MGMNEDLKLVGNNFTNAVTSLYVATLIAEVATGRLPFTFYSPHADLFLCVRRLHPSKNFARQMARGECYIVGYGHCVHRRRNELSRSPCLPHFPRCVRGCYVTLFDAHNRWIFHGVPISIKGIQAFVVGMWYTKPEAVRRFHIWFCGLGPGQILGGLISWVT